MKRSEMKRRTPLVSTGFKRKAGAPLSPFKAPKPFTGSSIKRRPRRPKVGDDKRMRDACRDEPCYLKLPGICLRLFPEETIVPAHRNEDKGAGLKNPDRFTLPACLLCHVEYDQGRLFPRKQKRDFWNAGYREWEPARAAKLGINLMEAE